MPLNAIKFCPEKHQGKFELGTASVLEKGQVQWETAGVMDTGGSAGRAAEG